MKKIGINTKNHVDYYNLPTPLIEEKSINDINEFIHSVKKKNNEDNKITKAKPNKINVNIPKLDFSVLSTPVLKKKSTLDIKQYIQNVEKEYTK